MRLTMQMGLPLTIGNWKHLAVKRGNNRKTAQLLSPVGASLGKRNGGYEMIIHGPFTPSTQCAAAAGMANMVLHQLR